MNTSQRPTAITVICILGFIGVFLSAILIFSPRASRIGAWYPPYLAVSTLLGLVSFVGMWRMKQWGVLLYTIVVVLNQVIMLVMGIWNPLALVIPLIVIAIGFNNFSKMD